MSMKTLLEEYFGDYTAQIDTSKTYHVAKPNEIKKGKAKILTVFKW